MPRIPHLFAFVLGAALIVVAGCEDDRAPQKEPTPIASTGAPPFLPPSYPAGRSIDTIASARINAGRVPMFVVASSSDSAKTEGRFDLVEFFAYDSVQTRWVRVLSDSIEAAHLIELRDVTGDGHQDILIPLFSGGNDLVSSNGLQVYSAHGGELRRVFRSTWMDPRYDSLNGIAEPIITVRRSVWPLFAPRSDAVVYIDDVFGFRDGRFRSIGAEAAPYYRAEATRKLEEFRRLRDSLQSLGIAKSKVESAVVRDSASPVASSLDSVDNDSLMYRRELHVFQAVAVVVLNMVRAGDLRGARAFWNQQREFLRLVLREEQFDELEAFCKPLIAAG